ncbi:hypothetical protein N658DRAFT_27644 [Parathielavia hyrcaniae]|uniref:CENP-V/GFA domain-containing protein n=1 Tax=Parathielavia hyrcaniae TaxID=113614 RepID=A0AAN6QBV2_9PEZI|nr:hypothetical protein N658DRAFT_27644 [Parathielavia hyrcaniae]
MMSFDRPLRGGCHCGRNLYIIQFPQNYTHDPAATARATATTDQSARVLFHSHPSHLSALATPLPSYLRVPLSWCHTLTVPFHADETRAQIRRVYDDERRRAKRHFCGFCGTPLSYWSEEPGGEADFIQLTLGSLHPEDLGDLEELGLLGEGGGSEGEGEGGEGDEGGGSGRSRSGSLTRSSPSSSSSSSPLAQTEGEGEVEGGKEGASGGGEIGMGGGAIVVGTGREPGVVRAGGVTMGRVGALPWFDSLVEGSRLGRLRRARGRGMNRSGIVRVEWEIVEWSDEEAGAESPRKRKLNKVEGVAEEGRMEEVQR